MNKKQCNIICLVFSLIAIVASIVYMCLVLAYAKGPLWAIILNTICHALLIMWNTVFAYDSILNLLDGDSDERK